MPLFRCRVKTNRREPDECPYAVEAPDFEAARTIYLEEHIPEAHATDIRPKKLMPADVDE